MAGSAAPDIETLSQKHCDNSEWEQFLYWRDTEIEMCFQPTSTIKSLSVSRQIQLV